jgi:hypothetical protein
MFHHPPNFSLKNKGFYEALATNDCGPSIALARASAKLCVVFGLTSGDPGKTVAELAIARTAHLLHAVSLTPIYLF